MLAMQQHRGAECLTANTVFFNRNVTGQFSQRLMVSTQPMQYSQTCYAEEECTLYCPSFEVKLPDMTIFWNQVHTDSQNSRDVVLPFISETRPAFVFQLKGEEKKYFRVVTESDSGLYSCTRTYGRTYNKTFTIKLTVKPNGGNAIDFFTFLSLVSQRRR